MLSISISDKDATQTQSERQMREREQQENNTLDFDSIWQTYALYSMHCIHFLNSTKLLKSFILYINKPRILIDVFTELIHKYLHNY